MRQHRLFVALGLGLLVAWWLWKTNQPAGSSAEVQRAERLADSVTTAPAKTGDKASTPAAPVPQVPQSLPQSSAGPVLEVQPRAPQKASEPQAPPVGHLEFEVVEGGIALAFGDVVLGRAPEGSDIKRGVTKANPSKLWPSSRIPYGFEEKLPPEARGPIEEAIAYFNQNTPVRFVPIEEGDSDALIFVPGQEICASYLGKVSGLQPIFVAPRCGKSEILHELMHALGFVHEHSRPDRDRWLEVMWDNIDPRYWMQFWLVPDSLVHDYVGSVFDFDPESIMLYGPTLFAKSEGLVTLKARGSHELKPSQGQLSRTDRERVFYLYGR